MYLTQCKNKPIVIVASTIQGSQKSHSGKRWCKEKKANVNVLIPETLYMYNQNMGGMNRMNQNTNMYCITIKGKEWW